MHIALNRRCWSWHDQDGSAPVPYRAVRVYGSFVDDSSELYDRRRRGVGNYSDDLENELL